MQRSCIIILMLSFLVSFPACQDKNVPRQQPDPKNAVSKSAPAQVYFDGNCSEAIVKEIAAARSGILVQAHSFIPVPVANALVEAHRRNIKVEVIMGSGHRNTKYDSTPSLAHAGIPVYIDKQAIGRSQTILVDSNTVITGPLDCGRPSDERNTENVIVVRSPEFAKVYMNAWTKERQDSKAYQAKPGRERKAAPKRKP